MSTQETNAEYTDAYSGANTPDRMLAIVHEVFARRSVSPSRPIFPDDDLRDVGLTSLDMVNLMLAVETEFEIKIPEREMTLSNFRSISAINALIAALVNQA